jgi:hypothetical protein
MTPTHAGDRDATVENAMDEGLLEAARAVRPYLKELVGPQANTYDGEVATLLAAAEQGIDVTAELESLFESDEATSSFLEAVRTDAPDYRPPKVQPSALRDPSYQPPPGNVGPILHSGKYSCPYGDFVWYRATVGADIPPCPTHGPVLSRT